LNGFRHRVTNVRVMKYNENFDIKISCEPFTWTIE